MKEQSSTGSSVGIVIVILILIVGGVYFFNQRIEKQKQMEQINASATNTDDVNSLQSDASSMNFDNLGNGVDQLQ